MNRAAASIANIMAIGSIYLASGFHLGASEPAFWVLIALPACYLAYREAKHVMAQERIRELERTLETRATLGL